MWRYAHTPRDPVSNERNGVLRVLAAATAAAVALTAASVTQAGGRRTLEQEARWQAVHGGILGTGMWQATPWMQTLARLLVRKAFRPDGREPTAWAMCVVEHESGWNPGAVNSQSGAAGLAQFEVQFHPEYSRWRILRDPVYAVASMHRLSHGGRDRSPWTGGGYSCP